MNTEAMKKLVEELQIVAQIDILEAVLSIPEDKIDRRLIENLAGTLRQELQLSKSPFTESKLEEKAR